MVALSGTLTPALSRLREKEETDALRAWIQKETLIALRSSGASVA